MPPSTPSSRPEPGPRTVLTVTLLHGHIHVLMLVFAGVQELMAADLGRSHSQMGFLAFWSYLAFGLGAPPAGWLADRLGARRILQITAAGTAGGCLLLFLSSSLAGVATGLIVLGLAASLYHPAGLGLLSRCRRRGRAFAIHGMGGSLGLALAPGLAASAAALAGGSWRAAYLAAGGVSLGILVLLLRPEEKPVGSEATAPAPGEQDGKNGGPRPGLVALALALVMMTALGIAYRGALTFLPEYLGQGLGPLVPGVSAVALGGWVATLALLLGVAGQWMGGSVLYHRFRLEALFGALLLPCLLGLLVLGLGRGLLLALGAALFGFFFFAAQPVGNGLVALYTPADHRSTGYGVHFLMTFGIGSLGAWMAGRAFEAAGGGAAFLAMLLPGGAAVVLAGLLLLLRSRTRRTDLPDPATTGYPEPLATDRTKEPTA